MFMDNAVFNYSTKVKPSYHIPVQKHKCNIETKLNEIKQYIVILIDTIQIHKYQIKIHCKVTEKMHMCHYTQYYILELVLGNNISYSIDEKANVNNRGFIDDRNQCVAIEIGQHIPRYYG